MTSNDEQHRFDGEQPSAGLACGGLCALRVVVPTVLLLLALLAGFLTTTVSRNSTREVVREVEFGRGRAIVAAVVAASRSMSEDAQVQKFVEHLASERGVTMVLAAVSDADGVSRVVASSRREWFGKSLDQLPTRNVAEDIRLALTGGTEHHGVHAHETEIDFTAPVEYARGETVLRGACMVHLDRAAMDAEVEAATLEATRWTAAGVVLQSLSAIGLLGLIIGLPLRSLTRAIERRTAGEKSARARVHRRDEIGLAAGALNRMLDELDRSEAERRVADRALADAELKFRSLVQNIPGVTYREEMRGGAGLSFASDMCREVLGIEPAELLSGGERLEARVFAEDRERRGVARAVACEGAGTFDVEYRVLRRDGEVRWVHEKGHVVFDDQGPLFIDGAIIDIHDRHQAEERLARNEARVRGIIDTALDAVICIDSQGRVTDWNAQATRTFGYTLEEARGREMAELIITPDYIDAHRAGFMRFMATGEQRVLGRRIEVTAARKDGATLSVELAITANASAEGTTFSAFLRDITEKKRAEAQIIEASQMLEQERERFELALSGGDLGAWDWNPSTGYVLVDSRWLRQLALTEEQGPITFDDIIAMIHDDDRAEAVACIENHVAGATEFFEAVYRVRHGDGAWRWILSRGRVMQRDESGAATRVVGTHLDITERQERQIEMTRLRDAAEAASRAKSEFLANMSHEIRTPLTAILGYSDLLREDSESVMNPARRAELVETIKKAGEHLMMVVNDILDISKIEAGRMKVESVETDLPGIIVAVESLLRPRAQGKGLAFTCELKAPIPSRVLTDPTRVRQILINLCGNAIKFTERGEVRLCIDNADGVLVVDVIDTGLGMSPEQAAQLFQAFSQADTSMSRRFGGTGLGLTISRRLAELLEGDVQLVSTAPGVGSTFRITLPLRATTDAAQIASLDSVRRGAAEVRTQTTAPDEPLRGRILLAEDGPDNQRLISFHLRRAGAEVVIAENGAIALELLDRAASEGKPFDLLITDMQMPEIDGYTLASTLRERGSRIAIVALTAHAMAEDRAKCIYAGCDDYTTKPIDKARLLQTARRWIGRRAGSQTTSGA